MVEALCPEDLCPYPGVTPAVQCLQGKALGGAVFLLLAPTLPRPQPSKKLSSVLCKLLRLKFSDLKHRETWSKLEGVLAGFKRKITYK